MNPNDVDLNLCSPEVRQRIGMAAQAAFLRMCKEDPEFLPDMMKGTGATKSKISEDWRHRQVRIMTAGRASRISELTKRDEDEVLAKFADMAGQPVEAFRAYMRAGKATGKAGADGATQAAVASWLKKCYTEGPGYGFNRRWMCGFVRRWARSPEECTPAQLKSLYVTMRSRYLSAQKSAAAAVEAPEPF